jgi:hypothetical protein
MAILSAAKLRDRETPVRTVDIGDGDEVKVRRPDLQTLLFEGILQTTLVNSVVKSIKEWSGTDTVTVDMVSQSDAMREFINRWVCAAVVEPTVVYPDKDDAGNPLSVPDGVISVLDLTLKTRTIIFNETFQFKTPATQAVVASAERFPPDGPSETTGQDVPEVLPTAE